MDILEKFLLPIFLGFLGAVIGPLVTAVVTDLKDTKNHRRERIKEWRRTVAGGQFVAGGNFLNTRTYSEIRPYLSEKTREMAEGGTIVMRMGRGGDVLKTAILDDLSVLEKDWKLLD